MWRCLTGYIKGIKTGGFSLVNDLLLFFNPDYLKDHKSWLMMGLMPEATGVYKFRAPLSRSEH